MAKKTYNNPINKYIDWGGDINTENLPVAGEMVQKFIKDTFNSKVGEFYYDTSNNRYLVFADEDTKNEYLEDPTKVELILGTFDAPFNYSAEINLITPTYNSIFIGTKNNYIDFTFDIKNKQNASTGEDVLITYTFIRNGAKTVVNQKGRYKENIHFNIDKYINEGVNNIIIGIVGQNSLAATTISVTYQVINVTLSDSLDISKVYDLSTESKTLSIPYSISGSGTKIMEWYLDGELLEFVKNEDETVDTFSEKTKHINLSNLQQGKHSIQYRAYVKINEEKFYTDTLYRDIIVYTGASTDTIIALSMTIPNKYGIATDPITLYGITQYIPYTLNFATYSPINAAETIVEIYIDEKILGNITSVNNKINSYTMMLNTSGDKILKLKSGSIEYSINMNVANTSLNIEELTDDLEFYFSAKDRSNNSTNKDSWQYNDYIGTFNGFNWNNTSGWVNNRLKINAGASFMTNFAPLSNNPTSKGCTLEFEFKTTNVINDNAIICDLRNSKGTGILITATKAILISDNGAIIETEFKAEENVRISFVINRKEGSTRKGMSFICTNGIVSRCINWAYEDNYDSDALLSFSSTNEAAVELKSINVYNFALSDDQILNNHILYRDTESEMLEIYDRNDIYIEGTTIFSPDKMSSRLPVMIITGDISILENTSDSNTQIVVDIEYNNIQYPHKSFKMVGAAMRPQGTSSMGYPKKNFRIYTNKLSNTIVYDADGKIIKDKLYAFKDKAKPVDCWCLKADYAESSGTHNTGIAKMWNNALFNVQINGEYVCRTDAQKAAISAEYPYDVRTTIDGFPILLFYKLSANDQPIFIGKYNFNNDKSTESVFGFVDIPNFDNTKMQCWEILNNGNPLALFKTIDGFDDSWSEAYESRYPDTKTPNTSDLKAFSEWMVNINGDHERFATEKWNHFKIYLVAAYYCYLIRHGAADQFVKNAMLTSEDGIFWYFILYDNDTINGLINSGPIGILPTDDRQSKDVSGEYKFAGHDSVLWNMLESDIEFMNIVKDIDNALYSAGISYLECVKIFDEEQADKWVERVYNQDAQYKYIGPYIDKGVNNLFMLQGKRDLHRRWWLSKRFSIYDAKFVSGTYKSQAIELKCINNTPAGQRFTIKAGYPLDYGYGINNVPRVSGISLNIGESYTFSTSEVVNLGDPIRIYGAPNIEELDLSEMASRLSKITIDNVYDEAIGTKLKKLIIGKTGVENIEISEISGLKQAEKLEYLDVQGMANITSLDLSNQIYLKTLKAKDSNIASITFAKGALLTSLQLPSTMRVLSLEQLPLLDVQNISFANITNISNIRILSCPNISNNFIFVYNWYLNKTTSNENSSLIMDNIDWKRIDADKLIELTNIKTLELKGKVLLNDITLEQLTRLMEVFGKTAFDQNADFVIDAPNAVFILGKTEILEGSTEQYSCISFGSKIKSIRWNISSGGNTTYTSIDQDNGLLTVLEGAGNRTLGINAIVTTDNEVLAQSISVVVSARVYPTSSQTSIIGETRLEEELTTYTLAYSVPINGTIEVDWSLSGMDGYAEILSSNNESCVIKKVGETVSLVQGSLSCVLKKKYNNSTLFTITKTIQLVNDNIAETDAGICQALYDAGLCANNTYITKEEAAIIVASNLQKGSNYSTSIFYKHRQNIKSFNGFKWFISVTSIPNYAFYWCTYLTSITIPESVTSIESYAFDSCSRLTSITIPNGVTSLGGNAFNNCSALISIIIPNGVTRLNSGVFTKCTSLTSITLPESVTYLDGTIFYDCTSLTSVNIPNRVTYIGDNTFLNCVSLTSINIPESVTFIGAGVCTGCNSLNINVDVNNKNYSSINGVLFNKTQTSIIEYAKDKIQPTYSIPNGVNTINMYAFSNCTYLTSINIPDGVTSIKIGAFTDCSSLTSINIPESVTMIGDINGNSSVFRGCTSLKSITLPNGITTIGNSSFSNCSSLTSINIPNRVTYIGNNAFNGCTSLASITLPESVTYLADYAFERCISLTSITIPAGVTNIGNYAFNKCVKLKTFTCLSLNAPTIRPSCFGSYTDNYTGRNTYNTGENMLYVPNGATGYDTGEWLDPLQNPSKCGFTLSATL